VKDDDIREYAEVCFHGHQRPFRQHVQHGRNIPFPAVSPIAAQADLLTNLMTDFPEMTIATDRVDAEMVESSSALGH
jgi:hypothetical protein